MNYKQLLKQRYNAELARLQLLQEADLEFTTISLQTNLLPLPGNVNGNKSKELEVYKMLASYNLEPAVYYFEIEAYDNDALLKHLHQAKEKKDRAYPKSKLSGDTSPTKILYVGSVKTNFYGRIIQHLGYGHRNTYALHLSHWAIDIPIKLKLHYCILPPKYLDIIRDIEATISEALNPLVGKREE